MTTPITAPGGTSTRHLALWALAAGALALAFAAYPLYDYVAIPVGIGGAVVAVVALARRSGRRTHAVLGLAASLAAIPVSVITMLIYSYLFRILLIGASAVQAAPWLAGQ